MKQITTLAAVSALLCAPIAAAADRSLDGLKSRIIGTWTSIACELRPGPNQANPDGPPLPNYLTRDFTYNANGGFSATIIIFADPACTAPMISYDFSGDINWHGENPAVAGAWSQDYVLNASLTLTPLADPMTAQLNSLPAGACGSDSYETGKTQDILGKPCILLKYPEGSAFVVDHDFLHVRKDTPNMLFMGGKHVDGTGFYYPENRPTVGLQQPLLRVTN